MRELDKALRPFYTLLKAQQDQGFQPQDAIERLELVYHVAQAAQERHLGSLHPLFFKQQPACLSLIQAVKNNRDTELSIALRSLEAMRSSVGSCEIEIHALDIAQALAEGHEVMQEKLQHHRGSLRQQFPGAERQHTDEVNAHGSWARRCCRTLLGQGGQQQQPFSRG